MIHRPEVLLKVASSEYSITTSSARRVSRSGGDAGISRSI